ncbi:hypothetical protein [Methanosphaera sp. WGK6]|uniref:hypothetical protein n=1 Tax=Methanosphaera sp. WGK6 TaxID=1561964 RepID=UPI00084CBAFE|nr:hypothetical protein [Methanosphaera sp. WGK6]OED30891.1 hypothetical protein NL43_00855 [Methanosphaera sp. WGK6]
MAFLKDVESEELRELVKSCFKEINSLKEQLNDENKDIKTNEVVKNLLIQTENNSSTLQAKIGELTDEVSKKETSLKEKELQLQEKDTQLKEKDLKIKEMESQLKNDVLSFEDQDVIQEYKDQIKELELTVASKNQTISDLKEVEGNVDDVFTKELKEEIDLLKIENEKLKKESSYEPSQTEITQLKSVIDRQNEELKEIPTLKNQLTREVTSRDQKIKKYEEQIEELNNASSNVDTTEYESKIDDLEQKIIDLEKTNLELSNSSQNFDVNELNNKIIQLEQENKDLREKDNIVSSSSDNSINSLIDDFTKKSDELISLKADYQRLQDSSRITELQINELKNENAKLKSTLNQGHVEDNNVVEETKILKQELSSKEQELKEANTKIVSLTAEITELTEKFQEIPASDEHVNNSDNESIKKDLIDKNNDYIALKEEHSKTLAKYEVLESNYSDLEKLNKSVGEELSLTKEKLNEQDTIIKSLTTDKNVIDSKVDSLEQLLSEKDNEISDLKLKIDSSTFDEKTNNLDLNDELKATKKQLYDKDAEYDKLKLEYNQLKRTTSSQITELNEGLTKFTNDNEKILSENEYLEKTLDEKNKSINQLEQENNNLKLLVEEKDSEYETLKKNYQDSKINNADQLNELKKTVQDKNDKLAALPQKLELKDIEISQLKKLLKTAEQESASKNDDINDLRNNVQVSQEKIKQLNDQLSESSIVVDDKLKAKDDEIFKLKETYNEANQEKDQEINKLNSLINQRNYKIEELNENIVSLGDELDVVKSKLRDKEDQYIQSEEIIQSKDDTLLKKDELISEINERVGRLENKLKLKDEEFLELKSNLSEKESLIKNLKVDMADSNKKLVEMDALSTELSQKDDLIKSINEKLENNEKQLQENIDELANDQTHINELKDILERKNKEIEDHKLLLSDKNTELDKLKDLQPRLRELELEKADMKSDYEQQITSLTADLQKAELLKEDNEKKIQEINKLSEQISDKDEQISNFTQYKEYFDKMVIKPLPGLTSFQSQIYQLVPDAKSATELYDYLMDLGFMDLEKENFAKTLKALEKRGYYQRARDGDRIIWVKTNSSE